MKRVNTEYAGMYKNSDIIKEQENLELVNENENNGEQPTKGGAQVEVNVAAIALREKPVDGSFMVKSAIFTKGQILDLVEFVNDEWAKVNTEKGEGYMMRQYLLEV